ncbi:hypothetical protein GCM10010218_14870 [Streptomyces mashuensis]|uniref:Uncharacterized protein n=1 Tax=Streptomyces mashuensis TaxID=33904 RepID=A0A919AZP6_9ACTN|nr:hypothetical protein GCM10010218_14870 [Streptomyces mashuensis]
MRTVLPSDPLCRAAYPARPKVTPGARRGTDWRSTPLLALMYVSQRAHAARETGRRYVRGRRADPL